MKFKLFSMNNITCIYCKKPISNKKEFIVGGKPGVFGINPCHYNCFHNYQKKLPKLRRRQMIKPDRLIFMYISLLIASILILLIIPFLPLLIFKIIAFCATIFYFYICIKFYKYNQIYKKLPEK